MFQCFPKMNCYVYNQKLNSQGGDGHNREKNSIFAHSPKNAQLRVRQGGKYFTSCDYFHKRRLVQQILIKHLLWARHCFRLWRNIEKICLHGVYIPGEFPHSCLEGRAAPLGEKRGLVQSAQGRGKAETGSVLSSRPGKEEGVRPIAPGWPLTKCSPWLLQPAAQVGVLVSCEATPQKNREQQRGVDSREAYHLESAAQVTAGVPWQRTRISNHRGETPTLTPCSTSSISHTRKRKSGTELMVYPGD